MAKRGSQTTRKMFISQMTMKGLSSLYQDKSHSNFGDYEHAQPWQTPSRMSRIEETKDIGTNEKVQNFIRQTKDDNEINFKKILKQRIQNSIHRGIVNFDF